MWIVAYNTSCLHTSDDVGPMTNQDAKTQAAKTSNPETARKPFEAPQLRREAELTQATAERTFTFGATAS